MKITTPSPGSPAFRSGEADWSTNMEKITHLSETDGEMLLRIAKSFAGPLLKSGAIQNSDFDDIVQRLVIDIIEQLPNFDSDRSTLSTYVHMRMETMLKRIMRDFGKKNDFLRCAVSLNEMVESEDDGETERIELLISPTEQATPQNIEQEKRHATLIRDVQSFIATLPPLEKKVCLALMESSHRDAAKIVGITYAKIRIVMQKIKAKMEAAGFEGL